MKDIRKPIKTIKIKLKPKGFASWFIEHANPSISFLPSKDDNQDLDFHGLVNVWELAKDRLEFKIGFSFKF